MNLIINGENHKFGSSITIDQLLVQIGIDSKKVAVERNHKIVPKSKYVGLKLDDGDKIEIVHFIGGGSPSGVRDDDIGEDTWEVAGHQFSSRLIIGTGKYKDYELNRLAAEAAGSEMITVAVRRVNLTDPNQPMLVDFLDQKLYINV